MFAYVTASSWRAPNTEEYEIDNKKKHVCIYIIYMFISYLYICTTALLLWEVCAFGGLEDMTSRSLTRLRRRTARIRLNMGVSWEFSGCVDVRLILISHNMNNNVAKCHWCFVFKARLFTQYVVSKDGMHKKATKWTLRSKNFMIIIYKRKKIKRWKLLHFVQEVDRIPPPLPSLRKSKQTKNSSVRPRPYIVRRTFLACQRPNENQTAT